MKQMRVFNNKLMLLMLIWVINVCGSFDFFTNYPCWIIWYFYFKIEIHGAAFRELIASLLFYHIYSIFQDKTCFFAKFKAFLVPSLLVLMQTRVNYQGSSHYLIYCQNKPQTCFVELKGANISIKNNYNPYDQIMDTIKYLQSSIKKQVPLSLLMVVFIFYLKMELEII